MRHIETFPGAAAKKRYVCFWYDITGVAGPDAGGGVASREGDSLPFVFNFGGVPFLQ